MSVDASTSGRAGHTSIPGATRLGVYRPADGGVELQRYVSILVERRYVLLGLLVIGLLLAALWTSTQPKIYEARSSILVEASMPQVLGSEVRDVYDPSPGSFYMIQDYLQTSRRVIMSDNLSRRVAARLHLTTEAAFWPTGIPPKAVEEAGEALLPLYNADLVAETRILVVTARHRRPEWAKKIADAVADEFVEGNQATRDTSTQIASQQLADELDSLRKNLHDAEVAIYDFKNKHDMLSVNLEDKANQTARQIDKYTDAITEIRLRKLQRQSELEEVKKIAGLDPLHMPAAQGKDNEGSQAMLSDLRKLYVEEERRLAELRARYQDDHPLVQQQSSKVNLVLRELKREAEVAQNAANVRYAETVRDEQKVQALLEQTKQEGLRLTRLEIEYNKLKRDADSFQKQYTMVLNRTKETSMVGRLKLNNVRVLDYARMPRLPISPKLRVALMIAALLSVLFGVVLAFALDALDRSVKSQDDVEGKLLLPFLGMLPRFTAQDSASEEAEKGPPDLFVARHPRSTVSESCRAIRTNVLFAGAERSLKKILVTSSVAREGKTLSCISLGTVLAQGGARTLIVDADLRRPRISKALGLRGQIGLTNVLLGEVQVEDAVQATSVPNLFVLASGPIPPNPAELLDGAHFRQLLDRLALLYDRVMIDSPPAVPVTDPAILATAVDGVILVVRHSSTNRDAVKRAAQHILDVGGQIVGVVLNDIDTTAKGYRAYYGAYYHYYQSEYKADEEDKKPAGKSAG